ncbi:MAG TPA: hypothetical protein VGP89_03490 [Candidatus Angelobacter sp.]|jgi:hypothetical protein|nr:hypothetical protein [Candidatus Angelobacter sp.]
MRYRLALKTPPGSEPVTLQEAKDHLHETDTAQESVITGMMQSAREQLEDFTSRGFLPQTFTMYLDAFPYYGGYGFQQGSYNTAAQILQTPGLLAGILLSHGGEIVIPRGPLVQNASLGIDSIKYVDTAGATQTLDPTLYQVDPQSDDSPVRILPAYGKIWPATRYQPNAVVVQFQVGYVDAAHVPGRIKLAIKQTVADWFNNRDAVVVDARVAVQQLPNAAKNLLWDLRLF